MPALLPRAAYLPAGRPAPFRAHLTFCDLDVQLTCDDPAYLKMFLHTYHRFRAQGPATPPAQAVEITVYTTARNGWGHPMLLIDGMAWPLADPARLQAYVYELILFELAARVRSHILIHAAALVHNGRGIIVVGDSQHGKTTLVLALLRRGFRFLSDELAALARHDGWVYPFPRRLRIRPGMLELAGYAPPVATPAPRWLDKLVLDVEELEAGAPAAPAPLTDIIILHDPAQRDQPDLAPNRLEVTLDHIDAGLIESVRVLGGAVAVEATGDYPTLQITAPQPANLLPALEQACHARGILMLDVRKRAEVSPRFTGPARLEPISASAAIMHLLAGFHGSHRSAILRQDCRGQATRLYLELARLVTPTRCHRLHTGPLDDMADLVHAHMADSPLA